MSEVAVQPAVLLAVCPTCNEIRYRSKFPISSAEECKPENFDPVGEAPPAIGQAIPMCHACGAVLKWTTEGRLAPKADVQMSARDQARRQQVSEARAPEYTPTAAGTVETLFEARPNEVIGDLRETPGGIVVITNQRIVKVAF